ncbi:MAG: universal stress protein [Pseudomonadota bacterium]
MYKTILVHVDGTARAAERIDAAARLALTFESHLVGAAMTGLSPYMFPMGDLGAVPANFALPLAQLRADAEHALDVFEARVRTTAVGSFERRRMDEEAGMGLSLQARYCDLVVIGHSGAAGAPFMRADFPEYVLLHTARPVLVLPAQGQCASIGEKVLVAWNGSPNAVRAIVSALALLQRARRVELLVLNADSDGGPHGEVPGADMGLYLARHGVQVDVCAADSDTSVGEALLGHAADAGVDLIVMGAYGHSRFRDILLGGATRSVLAASPLPLWMAH